MVKSNLELLFRSCDTKISMKNMKYPCDGPELGQPYNERLPYTPCSDISKFRIAELEALADLYNIDVDLSSHNEDSTF